MQAFGRDVGRAQELDVRTQARPREVVLGGRSITGPEGEQARPRRRGVIGLPRTAFSGELFRPRRRGEPEDRRDEIEKAFGILLETSRERISRVRGFEPGGDVREDVMETRRETEGIFRGRRLGDQQLGPRGPPLEFRGEPGISRDEAPRP
jgi:hypothetical protein